MEKKEIYNPSTDGLHKLHGYVYEPTGEVKGIIQVVHGMAEHIERYEPFMRRMCSEGYLVFGHDHIGHGKSINQDSEKGFFGPEGGEGFLVEDVGAFAEGVLQDKSKKRILFGHSMGSFVVRLYAGRHPENLSGLIIMGTAGANPAAKFGAGFGKTLSSLFGEKHVSKLMYLMAFGAYNQKTKHTTNFDWLSYNEENIANYMKDEECGFFFTALGLSDMMSMLAHCNEDAWFQSIPDDLPILLTSGEDDPVGAYGKGPREVFDRLKKKGVKDLSLLMYEKARHEILLDDTGDKVLDDIYLWIRSHS